MNEDAQVIALAGTFQAANLVVELAHEGRCDAAAMHSSLHSVLRIDASSAAAAYGGLSGVRMGLAVFGDVIEGRGREAAVTRIAVTVLHLERKLTSRPDMLAQIRDGVEAAARELARGELDKEALTLRLGTLYADTVSTLKPRVIVQGNGVQLSQTAVVARIRALLLAAMRSAVLWRQMGGGHIRLFFGRRRLALRAREMLAELH